MGFRIIVPSDYRAFGLLGLRTIGPSDCWADTVYMIIFLDNYLCKLIRLAMTFHCHWYMHDRFTLFPQHTGLCLWTAHKVKQTVENGWRYDIYWSASSSRHFLRFLSNIFKKQTRNLCFTPLLFGMTQNDLPTKWIFIKIHYYDVAFFNRKWRQQKQFSPTFRNIVFSEAKAL